MSAQTTSTDAKSWALSTLESVPADRHVDRAGTVGAGRRPILSRWADIATVVHQSWRRRDLIWVWPVLVLVAVLRPR